MYRQGMLLDGCFSDEDADDGDEFNSYAQYLPTRALNTRFRQSGNFKSLRPSTSPQVSPNSVQLYARQASAIHHRPQNILLSSRNPDLQWHKKDKCRMQENRREILHDSPFNRKSSGRGVKCRAVVPTARDLQCRMQENRREILHDSPFNRKSSGRGVKCRAVVPTAGEFSRRTVKLQHAVPTAVPKIKINPLFPELTIHDEKVGKKEDLEIKLPHIDAGRRVVLVFKAETARDKERPSRQRQHTRDTKESRRECPPTPHYWKHFREAFASFDPLRKFYMFPRLEYVVVDYKTHAAILELIKKTWRSDIVGQGRNAKNLNHKRIHVTKIERIENFDLYRKYSIKRMEFLQSKHKFPSLENTPNSTGPIAMNKYMGRTLMSDIYPGINEQYLFHGTTDTYVDNILTKGLDFRYSSETCMLGKGTYAAESSTKADQYADDPTNRSNKDRKMLLIRMLLGNMFVATQPYKFSKPPCQCMRHGCVNPRHEHFDSIVGDFQNKLFREFVVYSIDQCYPEYLITYDR